MHMVRLASSLWPLPTRCQVHPIPSCDNQKCLHTLMNNLPVGETAPGSEPPTSPTPRGLDLLKAKCVCREGARSRPQLLSGRVAAVRLCAPCKGPAPACRTADEHLRPRPTAKWKNHGTVRSRPLWIVAEPSTHGTSDRRVQIKAPQFPFKVSCFQNYSLLGLGWVFVFVFALVLTKPLKHNGLQETLT